MSIRDQLTAEAYSLKFESNNRIGIEAMRTTWTFHNAGELLFGRGAIAQLGEVAQRMNARRALVITDKTLVDAGLVDQVSAPLADAGVQVEVFDGGTPEPPFHAVNDAVAMAGDVKPDLLLGLGGGSNMDIAKAAAVVLAHGGAVKDYAGDQVVPGPIFPLILLPTTSGTGSEVTAASVLCDPDSGGKFGILSNYLRPRIAIVDPMLTVSCPPKVTAASGIDALTHAIEAYTAIDNENFPLPSGERTVYQGRHPLADVLAGVGERTTVWGGIPSIALLEHSMSDEAFAEYLDQLFASIGTGERLILGVADDVPPDAILDRLKLIEERIEAFGPVRPG